VAKSIRILVLLLPLLVSCLHDEETPQPNVLLIVIDSMRARNLSCYGYERNTTPNIDSLAGEGTLFLNCLSQSSWTLPSFASILTGTSRVSHGTGVSLQRRGDGEDRSGWNEWHNKLHPDAPFLASLLRDRGYRTYAHFNVAFLSEEYGFKRGVDHYTCEDAGNACAAAVVDRFTEWLENGESDEPFMAVLHLFDPHAPYNPPSPYDTLFGPLAENHLTTWLLSENGEVLNPENLQHYIDLYDGETAYADAELGRLFAFLRSEGISENTVVIVTADHGEEFLEHGGIDHGHAFFQEIIHVPLIIAGPGVPEGVVEHSWVGSFDILPTILAMTGVPVPDVVEGVDLFSGTPDLRVIPSSGKLQMRTPWICSVVQDGAKTLRMDGDTDYTDMVTDLALDPFENFYEVVDNCPLADHYMLAPTVWEPIAVRMDPSLSPLLRDLGYF